MNLSSKRILLTLACLLAIPAAFATNGYNSHGIGAKNKAMAGAGMAIPDEAVAIANNPASLTELGDAFDFGISIFSPKRKYKTTASQANGNFGAFTLGPDSQTSNSNIFFIPDIAGTWKIDDNSGWGFAFYGRGGMNTDWNGGTATFDPDGPGPAGPMTFPGVFGGGTPTGINLSQAILDLSYARKVSDRTSVGIAAVLAFQMFEAKGLGSFAGFTKTFNASGGTQFPSNLSNNGADTSFGGGIKIGFHTNISDSVSLAGSYTSTLYMSEFDDYSDLFASNGSFDIPAVIRAGISFDTGPAKSSFDIEHTFYSSVDSVGNPMANLFSCPAVAGPAGNVENCLGGNKGGGFGWEDVTAFKFGTMWKGSNKMTYRAGYSYTIQPINKADIAFNILAPGVMEHHFTFGLTKTRANDSEFTVAFMYAPTSTVRGPNAFDPSQMIEISMSQWEVEFSYGW